ncbi:hypothetical protein Syun_030335 [Stephania yunnanensis]|uniref:MORF/ORRM1/DAG-like MORF domain-containing protein n=1 Tax=Stephania yunnanensis TaxID=152371 RepID=A0AAP0E7D5_9MAGN
MALTLRTRKTLTLTSSLLKTCRFISSTTTTTTISNVIAPQNPRRRPNLMVQSHWFRSTSLASSSRSYNNNNDDDKISPDTILFEGCDYNHWLITMEFPKDPKPTAEEMVETYVQTLAKVVGSVEEAKKRMYACSTTTYNGFQAVMTEEMSEKFRGLPGVVFILPDSYIDPVNKEYGDPHPCNMEDKEGMVTGIETMIGQDSIEQVAKALHKEDNHMVKALRKEDNHMARVLRKEANHMARVLRKEANCMARVLPKEDNHMAKALHKDSNLMDKVLHKEINHMAKVLLKEANHMAKVLLKEMEETLWIKETNRRTVKALGKLMEEIINIKHNIAIHLIKTMDLAGKGNMGIMALHRKGITTMGVISLKDRRILEGVIRTLVLHLVVIIGKVVALATIQIIQVMEKRSKGPIRKSRKMVLKESKGTMLHLDKQTRDNIEELVFTCQNIRNDSVS